MVPTVMGFLINGRPCCRCLRRRPLPAQPATAGAAAASATTAMATINEEDEEEGDDDDSLFVRQKSPEGLQECQNGQLDCK